MSEQRHQQLQRQLIDLAHGELSWPKAFLLRRHILHCAACQKEWAAIQTLWGSLRHLAPDAHPASPNTIRLGGLVMKRRTVVAASAALLFALTGTVAARQWLDFTPEFAFSRANGPLWQVKTRFVGRIKVYDAENRLIGTGGNDSGGTTNDIVRVTVDREPQIELSGLGRHTIYAKDGNLLGYIELAAMTETEKREAKSRADRSMELLAQMYQPDIVTSSDSPGISGMEAATGLVSGFSVQTGYSWKLIGYAKVEVEDRTGATVARASGQSNELPDTKVMPPQIRAVAERMQRLALPRKNPPVLYWQLAEKTDGEYRIADFKWTAIRARGKYSGYGTHTVKDTNGRVALVFHVTPLTPGNSPR